MKELYAERIPLYERYADITINCDGKSIDATVTEMAAALGFEI